MSIRQIVYRWLDVARLALVVLALLDLVAVLGEPRGQPGVAQRAHQLVLPEPPVTGVEQRRRGLERGRVVERLEADRARDVIPERHLGMPVGEPPDDAGDDQHDGHAARRRRPRRRPVRARSRAIEAPTTITVIAAGFASVVRNHSPRPAFAFDGPIRRRRPGRRAPPASRAGTARAA